MRRVTIGSQSSRAFTFAPPSAVRLLHPFQCVVPSDVGLLDASSCVPPSALPILEAFPFVSASHACHGLLFLVETVPVKGYTNGQILFVNQLYNQPKWLSAMFLYTKILVLLSKKCGLCTGQCGHGTSSRRKSLNSLTSKGYYVSENTQLQSRTTASRLKLHNIHGCWAQH